MTDYFFDTSGLAKRYIIETGSVWVKNTSAPASGNRIVVAEITTVEITSAITRRKEGGSLTAADAASALRQFDADLSSEYFVLNISSNKLLDARRLVELHGLRAYDAVQLAVALDFNRKQTAAGLLVITFVSADKKLLTRAN